MCEKDEEIWEQGVDILDKNFRKMKKFGRKGLDILEKDLEKFGEGGIGILEKKFGKSLKKMKKFGKTN